MSDVKFQAQIRVREAMEAIDVIIQRLAKITEDQLAADPILIDACCFRICVLGEAISFAKEFQPTAFASTPVTGTTWDALIHIRNHFIHQYNKAGGKAVWMFYKGARDIRLGLANVLGKL